MTSPVNPAQFHDTGVTRWSNWHENVSQQLHRLYDVWNSDPDLSTVAGYNTTTSAIQQMLANAMAEDHPVRALGGGWSFSPVAATSGIMLNTRPLNYRFAITAAQSHPAYAGGAALFLVQCGMSIAELNAFLAAKQLALRTSGASNGQTIAGALATGTHGAAVDVGAVPDYVVALHLITAPNRSVWLERASAPATSDAVAGLFGAELIRNDDLFNAALVSFGSFGIVHGVVIETDPLYYLNGWRQRIPVDDAFWTALTSLDLTNVGLPGPAGRRPYHLQFLFNPFEPAPGIFATAMYRETSPPAGSSPAQSDGSIVQGDTALEAIGCLTDAAGFLSGDLSKLLTKLAYAPFENLCGTPGQCFRDTTTRGKTASCAMGVPLDRLKQAFTITNTILAGSNAPGLVAIRLVKSSKATLAFTRFVPVTAVLEVDGPDSNRLRQVYRTIWQALIDEGIPYSFHWGKLNNLDATVARRIYGAALTSWLDARRTLLPTPALRRLFSNEFTDRCDLSD